jgi:hypothetical protein
MSSTSPTRPAGMTFYTRPDIVHVAVRDIGPHQICLAWDGSRRSRLIAEFVAIAVEPADSEAAEERGGD